MCGKPLLPLSVFLLLWYWLAVKNLSSMCKDELLLIHEATPPSVTKTVNVRLVGDFVSEIFQTLHDVRFKFFFL